MTVVVGRFGRLLAASQGVEPSVPGRPGTGISLSDIPGRQPPECGKPPAAMKPDAIPPTQPDPMDRPDLVPTREGSLNVHHRREAMIRDGMRRPSDRATGHRGPSRPRNLAARHDRECPRSPARSCSTRPRPTHPGGAPGLPAGQPLEPGRLGLAAPPQLAEHHRLDRRRQAACATTRTWASSSCRPTRRRSTSRSSSYADESDKGPFPVPDNMPIEGWPASYRRTRSSAG